MGKNQSKKEKIKEYVNEHKTIIGITTIAGVVMAITIGFLWKKGIKIERKPKQKTLEKIVPIIEQKPIKAFVEEQCEEAPERLYKFNVNRHIRNLHDGFKASETKIQSALENNIELQPGQTWVDDYIKTNMKEEIICQSL